MISSWPTRQATGCSITLSPDFPPGKGKRSMCLTAPSSVGQGLPDGVLIPQYSSVTTAECQAGSQRHRSPRAGSKNHSSSLREWCEAVQNLTGACCQGSGQNKDGAIGFRALFKTCSSPTHIQVVPKPFYFTNVCRRLHPSPLFSIFTATDLVQVSTVSCTSHQTRVF